MQDQKLAELRAYRAYIQAKTPQERRDLWAEFVRIHSQRSFELVRSMERAKGLI